MTTNQRKLYWREWRAVEKWCEAHHLDAPERQELHRRAIGKDKSSSKLTNAEFDKVLAEFRAWSQPANLNGQLRQEAQPRTRLLYVINELDGKIAAFTKDRVGAYREEIMNDRWMHTRLDDLDLDELQQLRFTLTARERKLSKAAAAAQQPRWKAAAPDAVVEPEPEEVPF